MFGLFPAAGLAAVLAGALVGGSAQYLWWGTAIALDLVAAGIGGQREGWNLHSDHFAERHGLIVIIALGETLIVAASGLVGAPTTPVAIVTWPWPPPSPADCGGAIFATPEPRSNTSWRRARATRGRV